MYYRRRRQSVDVQLDRQVDTFHLVSIIAATVWLVTIEFTN